MVFSEHASLTELNTRILETKNPNFKSCAHISKKIQEEFLLFVEFYPVITRVIFINNTVFFFSSRHLCF